MLTSDWSRRPRARGAVPERERHGGDARQHRQDQEDLRPALVRRRPRPGGRCLLPAGSAAEAETCVPVAEYIRSCHGGYLLSIIK